MGCGDPIHQCDHMVDGMNDRKHESCDTPLLTQGGILLADAGLSLIVVFKDAPNQFGIY